MNMHRCVSSCLVKTNYISLAYTSQRRFYSSQPSLGRFLGLIRSTTSVYSLNLNRARINLGSVFAPSRYSHQFASTDNGDPAKTRTKSDWASDHIQKLLSENKAREAMKFFHNNISISCALTLLNFYAQKVNKDSVISALDVYDWLIYSNILPTSHCFVKLMYICNEAEKYNNTIKMFHNLNKFHIKINLSIFSLAAFATYKTKDLEVLANLIDTLKSGVDFKAAAFSLQNLLSVADFTQTQWLMDYMVENKIDFDRGCFVQLIRRCIDQGGQALELAHSVYKQQSSSLFTNDSNIQNLVLQMFAKCDDVNKSIEVFQSYQQPGLELWNCIIGLAKQSNPQKAVELYDQMIANNITPNEITLVNTLSAISNLGPTALEKGKQIHQHIPHKLHKN
eukprot:TRINITY_DN3581_c0_g1_i1.p1 TRINITY_DN3581_c0_g1~~TRINITY_DN3581_c0_g1_i1.p1  ORF type:complete len:394 (-),score=56.95 TRINITY_DN3581_c0_g1_i1:70-1251(-)